LSFGYLLKLIDRYVFGADVALASADIGLPGSGHRTPEPGRGSRSLKNIDECLARNDRR
jgi:hypothetical protein